MTALNYYQKMGRLPRLEYDTTSSGLRENYFQYQATQSDDIAGRVRFVPRPHCWLVAVVATAATAPMTAHPDDDHNLFAQLTTDALTSTLPAALQIVYSETTSAPWRGIFPLRNLSKTLFTQSVELRTADLPRWKPRFTPSRRVFEENDA